jgi:hypothetical protein
MTASTPELINERTRRRVFCVLSARALPYAQYALQSLFAHSAEPLSVVLITDTPRDKEEVAEAVAAIGVFGPHRWSVHSQAEADERAEAVFARHANLRNFRLGHPCWRKLTDPLLFADADHEMIILDPDLYFPNHFAFEPTPMAGVQLMWQPPSCLLPHEVVMTAYGASIRLAHHVDIGVAQLRNNLDLDWFDGLIGNLGGAQIPRVMHVEAIVWAALALRVGGGYFDPDAWYCWRYRQWKRVALRIGVSGVCLLQRENLSRVKCFHASGFAKWWLEEACRRQVFPAPQALLAPSAPRAFEELTLAQYLADQRLKQFVRKLGYYKIMGAGA